MVELILNSLYSVCALIIFRLLPFTLILILVVFLTNK